MDVNDQTDFYTILGILSSSLTNENSIVSVSSKEFQHVERWSKLLDFFRNLDSNNILIKLLVEQLSSLDEFLDHAQIVKILARLIKTTKTSNTDINEIRNLNRAIIPYLISLLKEEEDLKFGDSQMTFGFSLDLAKRKCIEAIIRTKIAKSCLLYYYSEKDKVGIVNGVVDIFLSFIENYDSFTKESMLLSLNFKSVSKIEEKRNKNHLINFHQGVLLKQDLDFGVLLLEREKFTAYAFRKGAINQNLGMEQNLESFEKLWLTSSEGSIVLFFQDLVEEKLKEELLTRGFCVFDALGEKKMNEIKETLGINVVNDIMSLTEQNRKIFQSTDLKLKIIELNKEKHVLFAPLGKEKVLTTVILIKEQSQTIFSEVISVIRSSLNDLFEILNGYSVCLNNGNFALKFLLLLTKFVFQETVPKGRSCFCNLFVPVLLDEIFLGEKYEETENDCYKSVTEKLCILKHFTSVDKVERLLTYAREELLVEKLNFITFQKGLVIDLKEAVDQEEFSDLIENINQNVEVSLLSKNLREYIYAFKLYDFFVGLYILKENS